MHEYSIAERIVRILKDVAEAHEGRVQSATVAVGPLTMIVPELLYDAWERVTEDTQFEDTALVIEHVPVVAVCEECGHETQSREPFVKCENCGSMHLKLRSGHVLQVTTAEIEENGDTDESQVDAQHPRRQ
ncbi:MAG: hydrogenase maturation nickel metallochaperone HypA [Armatimonadota bacterium]